MVKFNLDLLNHFRFISLLKFEVVRKFDTGSGSHHINRIKIYWWSSKYFYSWLAKFPVHGAGFSLHLALPAPESSLNLQAITGPFYCSTRAGVETSLPIGSYMLNSWLARSRFKVRFLFRLTLLPHLNQALNCKRLQDLQ